VRWGTRISGSCFGDEGERGFGVQAHLVDDGAELGGAELAVPGPGVHPEEAVGAVADLGFVAQDVVAFHQLDLGLVERAGGVAVEDLTEGVLEGFDG